MEIANGRSKLEELENVITEFQDQLFRFAFFRTGCSADSQDIVQEVFVKLYRENLSLGAVSNLKSYLYRSISNACIDYQRKSKRQRFESIDKAGLSLETNQKEVLQEMIQFEEYERLEHFLNELPNEQAEIIRLRFFDNLSFVEIASLHELPVTTVKSRFKYGIDKLKTRIVKTKEVCDGLRKL